MNIIRMQELLGKVFLHSLLRERKIHSSVTVFNDFLSANYGNEILMKNDNLTIDEAKELNTLLTTFIEKYYKED